jgi:MFS family permease
MNQLKLDSQSLHRMAWLIVLLLMPVALLNYLDRQLLASVKSSVMHDVPGIANEASWGMMLAWFKWVYACLSPCGGYVADRFGRRFTICGSLFVWSAITFWTGHVHTYHQLLAARSLMGISESFYIPAALALITDYHTGPTRSRAVGLHQIAIYLGVLAGGYGGYVADAPTLGWRFGFTISGIVGMLYAVPLVLLIREAPGKKSDDDVERSSFSVVARELLLNPSFLLLVVYFTLPAMSAWVVRDWMPAILKDRFSLTQGSAGVNATIYWLVAAMAGAFIGGWLSDRWVRRNVRGRIYISAIGTLLIIIAMFGVGNAGSLPWAVRFLIVFGIGWGFFDTNGMPILGQITRPHLRATGYGIMNFVSIAFGGVSDYLLGAMRDRAVPLNQIFAIFSLGALISVAAVLMIRPRRDVAATREMPA